MNLRLAMLIATGPSIGGSHALDHYADDSTPQYLGSVTYLAVRQDVRLWQKRTWRSRSAMSAFGGKADISPAARESLQLVGLVPRWRISRHGRRD
jgi:hypothetical protein